MKHTFKKSLANANAIVNYAREHKQNVMLVGDHGVYIMTQGLVKESDGLPVVAYADQVNPDAMEFDTWWENKRRGFGGDDGCDELPPWSTEHEWWMNISATKVEVKYRA